MTCRQLYLDARRRLQQAGVEAAPGDAALLAEKFLGLDRAGLALHGEEEPSPERKAAFLQGVQERCARRPLQYILGEWEFLGLSLAVGEGVLCPREDTAVLVETLGQALQHTPPPRGVDLCAGTGAVALGLLQGNPDLSILCVEWSDQALPYLQENLRRYGQGRATARKGDVLSPAFAASFSQGSLDFVASNPPYIATEELPTLQLEVQKEPALALDGGEDGLVFYRAIAQLWVPKVKPGGLVAVEIGETQGPAVRELLQQAGLLHVEIEQDWAGLDRVVWGRRP